MKIRYRVRLPVSTRETHLKIFKFFFADLLLVGYYLYANYKIILKKCLSMPTFFFLTFIIQLTNYWFYRCLISPYQI